MIVWRGSVPALIYPGGKGYMESPSRVLFVRPGTAGLLIDIECSRVRDSSWMYLISLITTRIGV